MRERGLAPIAPFGVVPGGATGSGIAQVAAAAGHPAVVLEVDVARADAAVERVGAALGRAADKGRLSVTAAEAGRRGLRGTTDAADLADCLLVVEAAAEDMDLKRRIPRRLEEAVGSEAVLAPNTSSLSIDALVEDTARRWGQDPDPVRLHARFRGQPGRPTVLLGGPGRDRGVRPRAVRAGPALPRGRRVPDGAAGADRPDRAGRELRRHRFGLASAALRPAQPAVCAAGQARRHRLAGAQDQTRLLRRAFSAARPGACGDSTRPGRAPARTGLALGPLLARTGVPTEQDDALGPWARFPSGVLLGLAEGELAAAASVRLGAHVVLLDLALDWATTTRVGATTGAVAGPAALEQVQALLAAADVAVTVLPDNPGLLLARTVALMVDEAADLTARQRLDPAVVDDAVRLGVNYPLGPVEWGDRVGPDWVVRLLDALERAQPSGRFRVSTPLRTAALTGRRLRGR